MPIDPAAQWPVRPPRRDRVLQAAAVVLAGLLLLTAAATRASTDGERWLLVDSRKLTLTVMDGDQPQLTLHNLSLGRYGVSREKRRGDNTTPLGRFRITGIDHDTRFHRFIGLDYPGVDRAQRGLWKGDIDRDAYRAIITAHRRGASPPQDTALGGHIGLHGLGPGDARLHEAMNWTKGCVALSNEQIDTLLLWVRVGMMVEIR